MESQLTKVGIFSGSKSTPLEYNLESLKNANQTGNLIQKEKVALRRDSTGERSTKKKEELEEHSTKLLVDQKESVVGRR